MFRSSKALAIGEGSHRPRLAMSSSVCSISSKALAIGKLRMPLHKIATSLRCIGTASLSIPCYEGSGKQKMLACLPQWFKLP